MSEAEWETGTSPAEKVEQERKSSQRIYAPMSRVLSCVLLAGKAKLSLEVKMQENELLKVVSIYNCRSVYLYLPVSLCHRRSRRRLHVNAHKTEYMCYNQTGDISTLEGTPLKLVDKFTYLGSSVESTEKDIETRLTKAWTAINRLSTIWKSDLTDKMKRSFFQAVVTSILLYGCTTWTLTKRLEKKLDGNYTRMLRAILNKSWQQHPTRHQLYGHLPPITKTIQVRRTRHAGHCWRNRDELIRDVLLWIPTHGRAKAGWPARTYIQQLCEDTGCCPEDLPRAMNDREEWRERVRDIRAASTIWWWWWWWYIINPCHVVGSKHTVYFSWDKIKGADIVESINHMTFQTNRFSRLISLQTSTIFVSGTSESVSYFQ